MAVEIFKLVGRITYEGQKVVEQGLENLNKKVKDVETGLQKFDRKIQNAGNQINNFGKMASNVGGNLTKWITGPVLALGAAFAGISIAKGFQRLTSIDTARAKLDALGHSGENIEAIMESALESVTGTSFGLEEAVTAAASAVAAGIAPGEELTEYLTNIADTSAIAGTEFNDTASIFNKIQTGGKATREELNQLADRGLPVFLWLQEEIGATNEELQKMVSDGSISSEQFLQAVEKNIGGAAQVMGEKSFTAALANMWAAVGRLGASFLDAGGKGGGFFSQLKPILGDITAGLDNMGDVAERAGVKLGEMFANFIQRIRDAKAWFDGLDPSVQNMIMKIAAFASTALIGMGPVLMILGKVGQAVGFLITMIGKIGLVTSGWIAIIGLLVGAFIWAYTNLEGFREKVNEVFQFILGIIQPIIEDFAAFFMEKIAQIKEWWDEHGAMIMEAFENVFTFILDTIMFIIELIMPLIEGFIEGIKTIIDGGLQFIMGIIEFFAALFTGNWEALGDAVKKIVSGFIKAVLGIFQVGFITRIFGVVKNFVGSVLGRFRSWGSDIIGFFTGIVSRITGFFRNMGSSVVNTVRDKFNAVREGIMKPITAARDGIQKAIDKIKSIFSLAKLKLPKPKLPKFSIKGGFSLMPPKVPKLSIEWFRTGGIFGGPSIIGVGEEPGVSEAVIPLKSSVLAQIGQGIAAAGGTVRSSEREINNETVNNDNRTINISVDAGNIEELQRIIEIFTGLKQTVRSG